MKKKAFTLIETMIAALIAIMVLGAGIVANRATTQSGQAASEQIVMRYLAEEAVSNLETTRNSWQAANSGGDWGAGLFGMPANQGSDQTAYLAFLNRDVSASDCIDSTGSQAPCALAQDGGPLQLDWCSYASAGGGYICSTPQDASQASPIRITDQGHISWWCGTSGECPLQELLSNPSLQGDLVGVRRTLYGTTPDPVCGSQAGTSLANSNRRIIDAGDLLANVPAAGCLATTMTADWDFYVRQIKVTRLGTGSCPAASPQLPYFSQAANLSALCNHTYRVSVTVFNYYHPDSHFIRSMNLYDTSY